VEQSGSVRGSRIGIATVVNAVSQAGQNCHGWQRAIHFALAQITEETTWPARMTCWPSRFRQDKKSIAITILQDFDNAQRVAASFTLLP
jgi:hypothetical protein